MSGRAVIYAGILLLLCFIRLPLNGQKTQEVRGMVVGTGSQPVSNVSVSIEGFGEPAITNEQGKFQLTVPSGYVWLLIAPLDHYKPQRVFLNRREFLQIQLTPHDVISGHDEVIDLLQPSARRDIISSFSTPDPARNHYYPYQSIEQSFQGTVSGMLVTGASGMPGRGASTAIRGIKSLNTNNQPLYVIDGIPLESPGVYNSSLDGYSYNPLSSLDPFDITNITILKDYASIATYGSRASNGVILIETLKPTEVRTTIDFSIRTGMALTPELLPQLNNNQYRTYANEILNTSGGLEENYRDEYPGLFSNEYSNDYYRYMHNTLWQNEIFRNALMNDVYLRVRGGDEIARYGLSVGFMNQQGIIKNTDYDRVNIRFVGAFNIFQWLRMNVSNNLVINNSSLKESARVRQTSPVLTSLFKAPLLMPFSHDDEGNQLAKLDDVESLGISNPSATIKSFNATNNNYRLLTSFKIEGDLSNSLKINSVIGINFNSINESIFMPNHGMETYYDDEAFNAIKSAKNFFFAFHNDNYILWSPELGKQHQLSAAAGLRMNMNNFEEDWAIAKNSHENDEYRSLQDGLAYLRELGGLNAKWNRLASYLNVNYTYRDKYTANGTLSLDASSRIGDDAPDLLRISNAPFGIFGSAGLGWRLSEEEFLRDLSLIDELKLRFSYGMAGNDDIGNYASLDYYMLTHYRETSGMVPTPVSNTALKFETLYQWNTGMDLSLKGNMFNFALDVYHVKTTDLLVYERLPFYLGESALPVNNGTLSNLGIEFSTYTYLKYSADFKWSVAMNLAKNRSRILEITDGEIITSFHGGEFISRQGASLLNFYGYQFKGVISDAAEATALNLKTEKGIPFGAGDAHFEDISGPDGIPDGIINDYDKTLLGSPIPDLFGGFENNFSYKRWSLNASIQFSLGHHVYNYLRYQNEKMTDLSNQSVSVLNRWQYDGHMTDVPRAVWSDPAVNSSFSSRWIEDGSYLRLKNITLSYKIPQQVLMFRDAEFFITGNNLLTFSKYLGYDPEFSYSYNTTEMGIDYGLMPFSRRVLIGIKIGL
jgi:TonB-linked SusC/RagA family outer membrane protein